MLIKVGSIKFSGTVKGLELEALEIVEIVLHWDLNILLCTRTYYEDSSSWERNT
jgi:hypothetical protein